MNSIEILIAFVASFGQALSASVGVMLRLPRPWIFRFSLFMATATNGYAAFAYLLPNQLPNALMVDIGGDTLIYLGLLFSYLIAGSTQVSVISASQRQMSYIVLAAGLVFALIVPSMVLYLQSRESVATTAVDEAKVQIDSLAENVGAVGIALQDCSAVRSNQLLYNRRLLYLVLNRQEDMYGLLDELNAKVGIKKKPRKKLQYHTAYIRAKSVNVGISPNINRAVELPKDIHSLLPKGKRKGESKVAF